MLQTIYIIYKNETVIFVGSKDVHFRPALKFGSNDYCDIFVMHFFVKYAEPEYLPENYGEVRKEIQDKYEEKYKDVLNMTWMN